MTTNTLNNLKNDETSDQIPITLKYCSYSSEESYYPLKYNKTPEKNQKVVTTSVKDADNSVVSSTSSEESITENELALEGDFYRRSNYDYENKHNYKKIKGNSIEVNLGDEKVKNNKDETISSSSSLLQIEFTFHDMSSKFYHSLHILHNHTNPILSSSIPTKFIIDQIPIGTIVSNEGTVDNGDHVFGYATVVAFDEKLSIYDFIVSNCPIIHSISNVGLYIHGRMINLPIDIIIEYHQQLMQDVLWAIENDYDFQNQSYDWYILLANNHSSNNNEHYNNFDDEIFAKNSKFVYTMKNDDVYNKKKHKINRRKRLHDGKNISINMTNLLVITKEGMEYAMRELAQLQTRK